MQTSTGEETEQLGVAEEVAGHQGGPRAERQLDQALAALEYDHLVAGGTVGFKHLRDTPGGNADRAVGIQRL